VPDKCISCYWSLSLYANGLLLKYKTVNCPNPIKTWQKQLNYYISLKTKSRYFPQQQKVNEEVCIKGVNDLIFSRDLPSQLINWY
jgi:hypothetical protein